MVDVKQIRIKPIASKVANDFVRKWHYSGKVVNNSILHLGAFYGGILHGVMSFGHSINKKGTVRLVSGTGWNEFIELNRMAFDDFLPKNSESRSLSIAFKIIKKQYPHIKWVISFADGTASGDGTIYRASGFYLVGIVKNTALRINPKTKETMHVIQAHHKKISGEFRKWDAAVGYQLKYIYFLQPKEKEKLTVPILPFSKIDEMNAGMYKGQKRKIKCGDSVNARTNSISEVA